jgi:hypothetical protein
LWSVTRSRHAAGLRSPSARCARLAAARFERNRIGLRRGVRVAIARQTERELEAPRHESGAVLARTAQPLAQVGTHRLHAVAPHAVDRGREIVGEARGDLLEHAVEMIPRGGEPRGRDRQEPPIAQRAEQLELHRVHERSALERVELFDRLGLLARCELPHRLEEELVRARSVVLERRR